MICSRLGLAGKLILLVKPIVPGYESYDWGLYEIGLASYIRGHFAVSVPNHPVCSLFDRMLRTGLIEDAYQDNGYRSYRSDSVPSKSALTFADVVPLLDWLRQTLVASSGRAAHFLREHAEPTKPVWSGHVAQPAPALRRLRELAGVRPIAEQIEDFERNIAGIELDIDFYRSEVRDIQKQLRENAAEQASLERIQKGQDNIDIDKARADLAAITRMPGLIAVRFEGKYLVLHVRNAVVHKGKRYDLGDFTISFKYYNLSVFTVNRTRIPLGGDYCSGWHSGYFCFGNQHGAMKQAYLEGDYVHALNLALGAMNTVNETQFGRLDDGVLLKEIPTSDTWQRRVRNRPRRPRRI